VNNKRQWEALSVEAGTLVPLPGVLSSAVMLA
jgi:hypothetical protein